MKGINIEVLKALFVADQAGFVLVKDILSGISGGDTGHLTLTLASGKYKPAVVYSGPLPAGTEKLIVACLRGGVSDKPDRASFAQEWLANYREQPQTYSKAAGNIFRNVAANAQYGYLDTAAAVKAMYAGGSPGGSGNLPKPPKATPPRPPRPPQKSANAKQTPSMTAETPEPTPAVVTLGGTPVTVTPTPEPAV